MPSSRTRLRRAICQVCNNLESKYVCPMCQVLYCSVQCYQQHKSSSCNASTSTKNSSTSLEPVSTQGDSRIEVFSHLQPEPELELVYESESRSRVNQDYNTIDEKRDTSDLASGRSSTVHSLSQANGAAGEGDDSAYGNKLVLASEPHLSQGEPSSSKTGPESKSELRSDVSSSANKPHSAVGSEGETHTEKEVQPMQMQVESNSSAAEGPRLKTEVGAGHIESPLPLPPPTTSGTRRRPLRPLSSLKWPYVPDVPSYPDPLTRDDPKPLSIAQYEAISRSPSVRAALAKHARLPNILRSVDSLRGAPRERALERMLGVAPSQDSFSLAGLPSTATSSSFQSQSRPYARSQPHANVRNGGRQAEAEVEAELDRKLNLDEEDTKALRELAEAIEVAVRSVANNEGRFGVDPLGLDWESMEV